MVYNRRRQKLRIWIELHEEYLDIPDREQKDRGKQLHTTSHKSEIPLENATDNPLDNSRRNPLNREIPLENATEHPLENATEHPR